jgi:hypothetical protein
LREPRSLRLFRLMRMARGDSTQKVVKHVGFGKP